MRNRLLRHTYFTMRELISLTAQDKLILLGLFCVADRQGRLVYNEYKIEKFFKGIHGVKKSVWRLIEKQLISHYIIDGIHYLSVCDWLWEGQRIFGDEPPSKLPPLTPEKPVNCPPIVRSKKIGRKPTELPDNFKEFISGYPKKDFGKNEIGRALVQWQKLIESKSLPPVDILLQFSNDLTCPPNPSTFLKYKLWIINYVPDCRYCDNERIVYGTKPDGSKGQMPCPKCQTTRQIIM